VNGRDVKLLRTDDIQLRNFPLSAFSDVERYAEIALFAFVIRFHG